MDDCSLEGKKVCGNIQNDNPWVAQHWYPEKEIARLRNEILNVIASTFDFGAGEDVVFEKFITYHILKAQIDELFNIKDINQTTIHYTPRGE